MEENDCETVNEMECKTETIAECRTVDKSVCTTISEPVCTVTSDKVKPLVQPGWLKSSGQCGRIVTGWSQVWLPLTTAKSKLL